MLTSISGKRKLRDAVVPRFPVKSVFSGTISLLVILLVFSATVADAPKSAPEGVQAVQSRPLDPAKVMERDIKPGEIHSYTIALEADQFLQVVVEQQRVDAGLGLYAPDGSKLLEVNSPNRYGPEPLVFVAERSGIYRLEVRSPAGYSSPGRYSLKVEGLKVADDLDRKRVRAQQALMEAHRSYSQATPDLNKSSASYDEAASLYRATGDRRGEALAFMHSAWSHLGEGEYQKALDLLNQARTLWQS